MKQKIYIPQPIAAAGEDYLIEKGYEIVRGSGKTDKESIKNDIINTISKYIDIDVENCIVEIRQESGPCLIASIPIKEIKC